MFFLCFPKLQYRRKFRNNEEKYNQIVNKIFEYLRLTKIIQEATNQSDTNLPTLKQLEDLKIFIEQMKNAKNKFNIGRGIKILICVCMYNESKHAINLTLNGIYKNLQHMR